MTRLRGGKLTFLKSAGVVSADDSFDIDSSFEKAFADGEDVIVEGFISKPEVDIDDDLVDARAFEKSIEQYKKHPSIRREHQHTIGFAEDVKISDEGTWIRARITNDAPGEPTRQMILKGTLRGWSARFQPLPGGVRRRPEGKGLHITNARLFEATVTDIPRNSGGYLVVAKAEVREGIMKSLDGKTDPPKQQEAMMLKLLAALLNQAGYKCDEADEASMTTAIQKALGDAKDGAVVGTITKSLGIEGSATPDAIQKAIGSFAERVDPSEHKKALADLAEAQNDLELAKHKGRIPPAQRDFAKSLLVKDKSLFQAWVGQLPAIDDNPADHENTEDDAKGGDKDVKKLTTDLRKSLGVVEKEEDFTKLVNMKGHEITSALLGQPASETAMDRMFQASRAETLR